MKICIPLLFFLSILLPAFSASNIPSSFISEFRDVRKPDKIRSFFRQGKSLQLHVFYPSGWDNDDKRSCLVLIHGGGWGGGNPAWMYPFADWASRQGMVGISISYRLYKKPRGSSRGVPVVDCVKDVRSSIRYLRENADKFGIDPDKIVAAGASAGGHLAVSLALFNYNNSGDDLKISAVPNALVLMSPVIDTSSEGYGQEKIGKHWKALSPLHNVRPGMPPILLCHGTEDPTTPFEGAEKFNEAMKACGNACTFVVEKDASHTYMFKDKELYNKFLSQMQSFLSSLAYIQAPPQENTLNSH